METLDRPANLTIESYLSPTNQTPLDGKRTLSATLAKLPQREVNLPLSEIERNAPVDPNTVRRYYYSIRADGLLNRPAVWRKGNAMEGSDATDEIYLAIDGIHRLRALRLLGWTEIPCAVIECSEQTFWDLRITSATSHPVMFPRVAVWARRAYALTPWQGKVNLLKALSLSQRIQSDRPYAQALQELGLNEPDARRLSSWMAKRSAIWGIDFNKLAGILTDSEGVSPKVIQAVSKYASPATEFVPPTQAALKEAEQGTISRPMLKGIVSEVKDWEWQELITQKVIRERLSASEVRDLVAIFIELDSYEACKLFLQREFIRPIKKAPDDMEISFEDAKLNAGLIERSNNRERMRALIDLVRHVAHLATIVNLKDNQDLVPHLQAAFVNLKEPAKRIMNFPNGR